MAGAEDDLLAVRGRGMELEEEIHPNWDPSVLIRVPPPSTAPTLRTETTGALDWASGRGAVGEVRGLVLGASLIPPSSPYLAP
jgi:hypothetical protein